MNKQTKIAFVSGADANYFPLLAEWIHNIKNHPDNNLDYDICIMDTGLTTEQRKYIETLADKVITPDWPTNIPKSRIRGREYLKSCVCRPFINKLFAGYDYYFWMDADTWVQNWEPIPWFIKGASRNKIALTGQMDRAYPKGMRVKWFAGFPYKARSFYYSNAKKAFGGKLAREIFPYHVILAGAFCMHKDAPHWDKWQELIVKSLKKGKVFTAEQLTLGIMVHIEKYEAEILPAWCHWLCEFKPLWDNEKQKWVEPYLPHKEIGILHLSGFDEMRKDRSKTTKYKTTNGDTIFMNYRYTKLNGEEVL